MIYRRKESELQLMRIAGRIVAETHQVLKTHIQPGLTTLELDRIAETYVRSQGAVPSFKGHYGFPGSICTSVNEELVHGIPGPRILREGDIISIDIGAQYQGYHGDSAWTYPVGGISQKAQALLEVTERSLYMGLAEAKPGARLFSISHAVQQCAEKEGMSIVRELTGHGIGTNLWEDPQIPNYGRRGVGPRLMRGMVLAIEPMVNLGARYVKTLNDGWTVVTVDGSWCAHFEHTIAITADGHEIFTVL